jgi:hypothetical protein
MQGFRHCTFRFSRFGVGLLGGVLLWVGAGGLAYANHFPAEAVSTTKHNLANNPNILFGNGSSFPGGSEVCVFCHTPHGAGYGDQLQFGMAPLWNRKINLSTSYMVYDGSPNFEATSVTTLGGTIKGVSLACLSCHDGTIAFDALINLPGSGGSQLQNRTQGIGPGETMLATAMFGSFGGDAVDNNRSFKEGDRPASNVVVGDPFGGSLSGNDTLPPISGSEGAAPFPNLTTDLRDDHPISFEIPCGDTTDVCDPQFGELIAGSVADNNGRLLYLKRDTPGLPGTGIYPQDKRDRIRAYASTTSNVTTGSNANAYIECASCHNPHTPRTLFLRLPSDVNELGAFAETGNGLVSGGGSASAAQAGVTQGIYWSHAPNQASAICVSCHQK